MVRLLGTLALVLILQVAVTVTGFAAAPAPKSTHVHLPLRIAPKPAAGAQAATAAEVGYIPCDVNHAYGLGANGMNGAGITIAIVDAYDQPNIASDLHGFDSAFG